MTMKKTLAILLLLLAPTLTWAQTASWRHMHHGNRDFNHNRFDQAEQHYLQALKANEKNARALFDLADAYLAKGNTQAALKKFEEAAKLETDPIYRSMSFHNQGVIYQTAAAKSQQQERQQYLRQAIDCYKQALRNDPHDDATRYNLALCQKQLKDEEQKGGGNQNQPQPQSPDKQKQPSQQQQQSAQDEQQQARSKQQLEQLLNLTKQAEQRAREKVDNARRRSQSNGKNW